MAYIFSQVCVVFAMIAVAISYFIKNKTTILFLFIINSLFYCAEYILLSAWTGLASAVLSCIRTIWFFFISKSNKKCPLYVLIILDVAFVVFGILTWEAWFSVLPVICGLIFNYIVWQESATIYKWALPLTNVCFILYNLFIGSPVGVIADSIMIVLQIIGLVLYYKKPAKEVELDKDTMKIKNN